MQILQVLQELHAITMMFTLVHQGTVQIVAPTLNQAEAVQVAQAPPTADRKETTVQHAVAALIRNQAEIHQAVHHNQAEVHQAAHRNQAEAQVATQVAIVSQAEVHQAVHHNPAAQAVKVLHHRAEEVQTMAVDVAEEDKKLKTA